MRIPPHTLQFTGTLFSNPLAAKTGILIAQSCNWGHLGLVLREKQGEFQDKVKWETLPPPYRWLLQVLTPSPSLLFTFQVSVSGFFVFILHFYLYFMSEIGARGPDVTLAAAEVHV